MKSNQPHGFASPFLVAALACVSTVSYAQADSSSATTLPVSSLQVPIGDQDEIFVTHPDGTVTVITDPVAIAKFNADHMVDGKVVMGKDAVPGYQIVERRTHDKILDQQVKKITITKPDGSVSVLTDPAAIASYQAQHKNDQVVKGSTTTRSDVKSVSCVAPDGTLHTLTDPAEIAQVESNPHAYAKTQSQTSTTVVANLSPEQLKDYLASGAHVTYKVSSPDVKINGVSDPAAAQALLRVLKDPHVAPTSYYIIGSNGEKTQVTDPGEIQNLQKATERALATP